MSEENVATTDGKEEKGGVALSPKLEDVAKTIEGLTALELSELVKGLEDRLGISAAAPMVAGMMMPAGGGAAGAAGAAAGCGGDNGVRTGAVAGQRGSGAGTGSVSVVGCWQRVAWWHRRSGLSRACAGQLALAPVSIGPVCTASACRCRGAWRLGQRRKPDLAFGFRARGQPIAQ